MKLKYLLLGLLLAILSTTSNANDEYFGLANVTADSYIIEAGTNGRVFIGGWGTGFAYSTDNGQNFSEPTTGTAGLFINDISVDGTEILVTSTDEWISRSENNGDTFTSIKGDLADSIIPSCAVRNDTRIIIGTKGYGFFYSDDDGTTWTASTSGINYWDISDIERTSGDTLVAGTYGGGLYRSDDNGISWVRANNITNAPPSDYVSDLYRYQNGSTVDIYAAVNENGFYRSSDNGLVWNQLDTTGINMEKINSTGMAVMEVNGLPLPLAAFRDESVKYYDPLVNRWLQVTDLGEGIFDITVDENGGVFAIGAKSGIFYSDDNAEFWFPRNRQAFRKNAKILPMDDGEFYFFDRDEDRLFLFSDFGQSTTELTSPTTRLIDIKLHKNKIYGFATDTIFVYENNTWETVFDHTQLLGDGDSVKTMTDFVITPNDRIVAMYNTIFGDPAADPVDSRQYILDYNLITDQMDNDQYLFDTALIQSIEGYRFVANNASDVMLAILPVGNLYRVNGTDTWTQNTNTEFDAVREIGFQVNDGDFAFGRFFLSTTHGLFYSSDRGVTWARDDFDFPPYVRNVNEVLPNVLQFTALSANTWIAGMNSQYGLFYTADQGNRWDPRNESIVLGDTKQLKSSDDNDIYYFNNFLYIRPAPTSLTTPAAISPADQLYGVSLDSISLEWSNTSSPLYELEISRDEAFTGFVDRYVLAPTTIDVDLFVPEHNATYYWKVRSKFFGTYSFSNTYTFTTKLAVPELEAPADSATGIKNGDFALWSEVDGADMYTIEVSDDMDFTNIIFTQDSIESLTEAVSLLDINTTYYWRVKAENNLGNFSDWSEVFTFNSILGPPALVSPADEAAKVSIIPRFIWADAINADSYVMQISTSDIFAVPDTEEVRDIDTTFAQIDPLEYQTTYYWRVASVDSNDNQSDFSAAWSFTTGLPAVQLVSPADDLLNTEFDLEFVWQSLDLADNYDFELSLNPDMSDPVATEMGTTDLTYMFTGLQDYTEYYWRVRGNTVDEEGTWSQTYSFRTKMLALELLSPADEALLDDTKTLLEWSSPRGATQYDLLVSTDAQLSDTLISRVAFEGNDFDLLGLDRDQDYYWQVRGYNEDRTSSTGFSSVSKFTVIPNGSVFVQDNTLKVGPNPTSDVLNIIMEKNTYNTLSVIDGTGKTVIQMEINTSAIELEVGSLTTGNYFLVLAGDNTSTFRSITIE
jgi:photosystem II stability/assembly factor-like uncharacterized protein